MFLVAELFWAWRRVTRFLIWLSVSVVKFSQHETSRLKRKQHDKAYNNEKAILKIKKIKGAHMKKQWGKKDKSNASIRETLVILLVSALSLRRYTLP